MSKISASLAALAVCLAGVDALAITFTPFGPAGQGGSQNGQSLSVGPQGSVFELDAFVATGGGGAVSLAGGLPAGLSVGFSVQLSADGSDLDLRYTLSNAGATMLPDVTFLSFLDAEIAEPTTSFFNETATVLGSPAAGQGFEIDEPGFLFGDIAANLAAGVLDDTNALAGIEEDVSMALPFDLGALASGDVAEVLVRISEDGDLLGPLALEQADPLAPDTRITYSGLARRREPGEAVPEPTAALLVGLAAGVSALVHGRSRR